MIHNQVISTAITASIISITYVVIAIMMLNNKLRFNIKNILTVIIFVLVITIIHLFFNNFMRTLPLFLILIIVFKIIFSENTDKTIVTAFISYGILFLGELFYVFAVSLMFGKEFLNDKNLTNYAIINNFSISAISILIAFILRKKLKRTIKNISDKQNIVNITLCLIIILILSLLVYKLYCSEFIVDKYFVINGILMIIAFIIGIYLFVQNLKINSVEQKYQQFVSYSQEIEEMVEEYRILQHEFKNELIIIREMLDSKNNKVKDYINNLLKEKDMSKYLWAQELKNIPLDGLKGFLNYKIVHMINLEIDVNVTVSKEVRKSEINNLDAKQKRQIYNLIGVYVDNAIEAAAESNKKEIKIDVFKDKDVICFTIANTYKGKIEMDKIDNPGFSTKQKGHGYGLALVQNILKSTDLFSQERYLIGNLYVQKLFIQTKKDD